MATSASLCNVIASLVVVRAAQVHKVSLQCGCRYLQWSQTTCTLSWKQYSALGLAGFQNSNIF